METRTEAFAPSLHRTIVVVDVADFADPARTLAHQITVREGLHNVLQGAIAESGIDWGSCTIEDRGDGAMILIPPEVPKSLLADRVPSRLVAGLHRHNTMHSAEAAIQLRVGLHAGEVHQDAHGAVSPAINHAFRILGAAQAKSALRASASVVAFIASDWFYHEVIVHCPAADPDSYQHIPVAVKETSTQAWLRLSDNAEAVNPASEGDRRGRRAERRNHHLSGQPAAPDFDTFYLNTYRLVRNVIHARAQDWGLAEDVANEALAIAYRKWDELRDHPNPTGFVVVTARRILSRIQRQQAKKPPPQPPLSLDANQFLERHTTGADPADTAVNRAALLRALRALPPDQRECFVLHHILDYPIRQIAELLHIPEGTTKTRLHAARQALRALLNDDLGEGGDR